MQTSAAPREFVWRRIHSLMGFWLVLFLMEHLLTNAQVALYMDNSTFIQMVNALHDLPYLHTVEVLFLAIPILFHGVLGVKYALSGKMNARKTSGTTPSLGQYGRNRAYSLQRISSWILLFGIIFHVIQFRFFLYPKEVIQEGQTSFLVKIKMDQSMYTIASRLGITLYDKQKIHQESLLFQEREDEIALVEAANSLKQDKSSSFDPQKELIMQSAAKYEMKKKWISDLLSYDLSSNEVIAESRNFGTATLLVVRNVFKDPLYIGLYLIFVLAACFHAFNGLWTFLLTWGLIIRKSAQASMLKISLTLMGIISLLGLSSIFGTLFH